MELFDIYFIIHIFGVIIGAGAAFFGDGVFLFSHRDKHISKDERAIMHLSTKFVWFGLLLMVVSGVGLFTLDPAGYLDSASFLAKMTIVGIIIANGLVFTFVHHEEIKRRSHKKGRGEDPNFLLPLSGVVSSVSWISVVLLALVKPSFAYFELLSAYLAVMAGAFFISPFLLRRIVHKAEVRLLRGGFVVALVGAVVAVVLSRL